MKKQNGFTLIEIMISLLLGLIVLASTISIYVNTVGSSSDTIKSARLNHDLESLMTLMINDIKRSGYWGGARIGSDGRTNPFTTATTNINIINTPVISCILYSYDANNNGSVDANEYYGFKLVNNTLSMRKTGTTTNSADCSDGTWEEFVDGSQLTITITDTDKDLEFSFLPMAPENLPATSRCLNVSTGIATDDTACESSSTTYTATCTAASPCNVAQKRVVNILLRGHLTSDDNVTKTLRGTVEVRNSRLLTMP